MNNQSIIKSTRAVSAATLASRILGFIRDVIIAQFFGTGMRAQAFIVAFRIPNLLRSIVGEGSTAACVVPVFSRLKALGKDEEFWQAASCLANILIIFLSALILLGELFAPAIVRAIAPGFIHEPGKLVLAIKLTRWMFPYILLIGLTAYAAAILNSLKYFALSALAPCMLNLSIIINALIFCPRLPEPVYGLALGVLIGGLLQLSVQLPLLIKKGLFRKRFYRLVHPRVKEIARLFLPRTLGIVVYQTNVFVDTILATLAWIVGSGAVAALYYANRIVQLPLALFGIALAQVATPTLSYLAAEQDWPQLKKTISFSLRSLFTVLIPVTVGMMLLAQPLVQAIFERGTFSSYSTQITAVAVFFYCLGLAGYAGIKILAGCFYALNDTFTPVKIAGLCLAVNIILSLSLMWPLKMSGLCLATAISVTLNFILLMSALNKRIGKLDSFLLTLGRVTLAAAIMGIFLWFIFYRADWFLTKLPWLWLRVAAAILAALGVYIGLLKLLAKEEARILLEWILKKG